MQGIALFLLGWATHWLWTAIRRPPYDSRRASTPRAELPPASARRIARARRRNRPDLRPAINYDRRNWLPPSIDDFDHEITIT